jgi:hypothetical protein
VCSSDLENDIVVLYTGGKSNVDKVLPAVSVHNIHSESLESIGSCAIPVLIGKSTTGKDSQGKRRKKKKQKRIVKSRKNQRKRLNLVYQSPGSWSKDMSHFYNDSWGGEAFDAHQLQKSMPGKKNVTVFYLVLETFITCRLFKPNKYQYDDKIVCA